MEEGKVADVARLDVHCAHLSSTPTAAMSGLCFRGRTFKLISFQYNDTCYYLIRYHQFHC
jgi:hypothetical protein